jgi:hypothetical protein
MEENMKSIIFVVFMSFCVHAQVCITEVNSTDVAYAAYAELCNIGHSAIDVSGYTVTFGNNGSDKFVDVPLNSDYYGSGLVLSPGEFFLVLRSENSFPEQYPSVPLNTGEDDEGNSKIEYFSHGNLYLNGGADYLILKNASGQIVDRFNNPLTEWPDNHLWYRVNLPNDGSDVFSHWQDQGADQAGTPAAVNDVSLPVELSLFSARIEGEHTTVVWRTESEFQNFGFKLERSGSQEGPFRPISPVIPGKGTTTETHRYMFTDRLIGDEPDTLWYRLIQFDMSGQQEIIGLTNCSLTKSSDKLNLRENSGLCNYPNPFILGTTINCTLEQAESQKFVIVNSLGVPIKTFSRDRKNSLFWNGKNEQGVDVPSGLYICYLWDHRHIVSLTKMVKVK